MSRCPSRDRFELYLAERLDDRLSEELERHVESCSACQEVLVALAEVADWGQVLRPATAAGAAAETEGFVHWLQQSPPGAVEPLATRRDPQGGPEDEARSSLARGRASDRTEPGSSRSGPGPIDGAITLGAAPTPGPDLAASTQLATVGAEPGTVLAPRASIDAATAATEELASRAPPVRVASSPVREGDPTTLGHGACGGTHVLQHHNPWSRPRDERSLSLDPARQPCH
jgi:hypothetical protein